MHEKDLRLINLLSAVEVQIWNVCCAVRLIFFSCFVMLVALSPTPEPFIQFSHISSNNSCPMINHLPWVITPLWQKYLNSRLPQIIAPPPPLWPSFFLSLPVKLKVDTSNNKQAFIWLFTKHRFCYSFFYGNVHVFHFFLYSLEF